MPGIKSIHFIGIGGIGMSALAQLYAHKGYDISGCDTTIDTQACDLVRNAGGRVYQGNGTDKCFAEFPDIVVYSTAIAANSPEIAFFTKKNIPCIHRSELLAQLTREHKTIAVSGSHGKTTTSALIAHILWKSGFDPSAMIGGLVPSFDSNVLHGKSDIFVSEADESDRSFERLTSHYAVVTNIDREHVDVYTTEEIAYQAFDNFVHAMLPDGTLFLNAADSGIKKWVEDSDQTNQKKIVWFGYKSCCRVPDIELVNARWDGLQWRFDLIDHATDKQYDKFSIRIFGEHMLNNVIAACAVCLQVGITIEQLRESLKSFETVDRRFTIRGSYHGVVIVDDYGHHPTEIAAALETVTKFAGANHRVLVFFQPHRYTRTAYLWNDFVEVFAKLPTSICVVITDIYAASEEPIENINARNLVEEIKKKRNDGCCFYVPFAEFKQQMHTCIDTMVVEKDVVLFLGAGKIDEYIKALELF